MSRVSSRSARKHRVDKANTFPTGKRDTDSPWRKSEPKRVTEKTPLKTTKWKYGDIQVISNPGQIISIAGDAIQGKKEANRRLCLTKKKLTIANSRNQRLQKQVHHLLLSNKTLVLERANLKVLLAALRDD